VDWPVTNDNHGKNATVRYTPITAAKTYTNEIIWRSIYHLIKLENESRWGWTFLSTVSGFVFGLRVHGDDDDDVCFSMHRHFSSFCGGRKSGKSQPTQGFE
jgi:hypothetical protein